GTCHRITSHGKRAQHGAISVKNAIDVEGKETIALQLLETSSEAVAQQYPEPRTHAVGLRHQTVAQDVHADGTPPAPHDDLPIASTGPQYDGRRPPLGGERHLALSFALPPHHDVHAVTRPQRRFRDRLQDVRLPIPPHDLIAWTDSGLLRWGIRHYLGDDDPIGFIAVAPERQSDPPTFTGDAYLPTVGAPTLRRGDARKQRHRDHEPQQDGSRDSQHVRGYLESARGLWRRLQYHSSPSWVTDSIR